MHKVLDKCIVLCYNTEVDYMNKKLKVVVNAPSWGVFIEHMEELSVTKGKALVYATDVQEIHKHQGFLQCLQYIHSLRDNVNATT